VLARAAVDRLDGVGDQAADRADDLVPATTTAGFVVPELAWGVPVSGPPGDVVGLGAAGVVGVVLGPAEDEWVHPQLAGARLGAGAGVSRLDVGWTLIEGVVVDGAVVSGVDAVVDGVVFVFAVEGVVDGVVSVVDVEGVVDGVVSVVDVEGVVDGIVSVVVSGVDGAVEDVGGGMVMDGVVVGVQPQWRSSTAAPLWAVPLGTAERSATTEAFGAAGAASAATVAGGGSVTSAPAVPGSASPASTAVAATVAAAHQRPTEPRAPAVRTPWSVSPLACPCTAPPRRGPPEPGRRQGRRTAGPGRGVWSNGRTLPTRSSDRLVRRARSVVAAGDGGDECPVQPTTVHRRGLRQPRRPRATESGPDRPARSVAAGVRPCAGGPAR
jgi:hypothetical protein